MKKLIDKLQELSFSLHEAGQRISQKILDGVWWPPVVLLLVVLFWYEFKEGLPQPTEMSTDKYGQYGDSFGSLTSLFTALGFGGLIMNLALQQRQIRSQQLADERQHQKDAKAQYEDTLFRLLEIYKQTLSEVQVGSYSGRNYLRITIERVDKSLQEENVHCLPRDMQGRFDSGTLTETDRQRIDYLHFRNFKIVSVEINQQGRLLDTLEVLLEHLISGAPDYLLIAGYKDLVFAQITYIECKYFFLAALSITGRTKLRDLMNRSGLLDRVSRSSVHLLHRQMYKEYWGVALDARELPTSIPMSSGKVKRAIRAHQKEVGGARTSYTPMGVRQSTAASSSSKLSPPPSVDTQA